MLSIINSADSACLVVTIMRICTILLNFSLQSCQNKIHAGQYSWTVTDLRNPDVGLDRYIRNNRRSAGIKFIPTAYLRYSDLLL
jgi:hypothetical protein